MLNFEQDTLKNLKRRNKMKNIIKTDLNVAMKNNEDRIEMEKKNKAVEEELQKNGPPMMQEIELNQRRLEETTKQVNFN